MLLVCALAVATSTIRSIVLFASQPNLSLVFCAHALAAEYIMAGEIVIEYTGELVRRPVADAREREYAAAKGGMLPRGSCYMFAIDAVSLPHACCRSCITHADATMSAVDGCYAANAAINAALSACLLHSLTGSLQHSVCPVK